MFKPFFSQVNNKDFLLMGQRSPYTASVTVDALQGQLEWVLCRFSNSGCSAGSVTVGALQGQLQWVLCSVSYSWPSAP